MIVSGFRLSLQEFCSLDPQVIYQLAEILDTQNSGVDIGRIRQIWTEIEDNFQGYAVKKLYDIKEDKLSMLMQHLSNTQDLSKTLAQEGYNFVCAVDQVHRVLADCLSAGFMVDNSWQLLDENGHFVQNAVVKKLSAQLKSAYDDFELVDQQIAAEIFSYVKQHDSDTDPDILVLSSFGLDDSFSFDINNASWAPLWAGKEQKPRRDDVCQSSMNNCTVLATLAALADRHPDLLKKNIRTDPDHPGNYIVSFLGRRDPVTISHDELIEHLKDEHIDPTTIPALWPYVYAAAYAKTMEQREPNDEQLRRHIAHSTNEVDQMHNGDIMMHLGAAGENTIADLTGDHHWHDITVHHDRWHSILDRLEGTDPYHKAASQIKDALQDGNIILYGHMGANDPATAKNPPNYFTAYDEHGVPHRVVQAHAYEVVSVSNDGNYITLRNPWGTSEEACYGPYITVKVQELYDHHGRFTVGKPQQ